jgi:hypothetical protein
MRAFERRSRATSRTSPTNGCHSRSDDIVPVTPNNDTAHRAALSKTDEGRSISWFCGIRGELLTGRRRRLPDTKPALHRHVGKRARADVMPLGVSGKSRGTRVFRVASVSRCFSEAELYIESQAINGQFSNVPESRVHLYNRRVHLGTRRFWGRCCG